MAEPGDVAGATSSLWEFSTGAPDAAPITVTGTPSWLSSVKLQSLGTVNELWLGSGAPTTLSPLVDNQILNLLENRYANVPSSVSGGWVGTTVATIERLTKPQVNSYLTPVPGNTPVWVVELKVTPGLRQKEDRPGSSDWAITTTINPASDTPVNDSSSGARACSGS